MTSEIINLRKIDYSDLPKTGLFEILGKRGTGKTTWCQHILQNLHNNNTGIFAVMAGSETVKTAWSKCISPMFIHDANPLFLEQIKTLQNEQIRHYRELKQPFPPELHITLVLDDVASNKKVMRSSVLAYLASNSRHLHMSIFILAQYHCQIPAEIRNQFDILFMLATADDKSIKRVHSEYCSCVPLRSFRSVLVMSTKDYGLLSIDNRKNSSSISDVCTIDQMDTYPPDDKQLGAPSVWSFGEAYNKEGKNIPDEISIQKWKRKEIFDYKDGRVIVQQV